MAEQLLGRSTQAKLDGPLDWDQWQGPAQHRVPLDPFRFRNWRYISDYAGGVVADQGAHIFDGINMLKHAGFPEAVTAAAGKPHKAGADTPESVAVTAEYADDFVAVFTINYAAMRYRNRNDQLNPYDGDKARMDIGREEFKVYMQGAEETPAIAKKSERGFDFATDLHFRNFIDCMRTRNTPTARDGPGLSGNAGAADRKPLAPARQAGALERRPGGVVAKVVPKSSIGQAIAYTPSNWEALVRYAQDGDLEIDNNGAERSLRGIAVGRRNWTFFGSDNGGRTAAVLTSLVATCKRHHINPFAYLRDVFTTHQRPPAKPASSGTEQGDRSNTQWVRNEKANKSRAPTTATSNPPAITRCCCSTGRATV